MLLWSYSVLRSLSQTDGVMLRTLNAGTYTPGASQDPRIPVHMGCIRLAWARLGLQCLRTGLRLSALAYPQGTDKESGHERVGRQGVDRLGVSRSWLANQHGGPQPLKIGRDASVLKLGQNGVTETTQNTE